MFSRSKIVTFCNSVRAPAAAAKQDGLLQDYSKILAGNSPWRKNRAVHSHMLWLAYYQYSGSWSYFELY